jgi:hypothetical protein
MITKKTNHVTKNVDEFFSKHFFRQESIRQISSKSTLAISKNALDFAMNWEHTKKSYSLAANL